MSTTKRGIILTTDIQVASSQNLSIHNDVMHLPCSNVPLGIILGGMSWLVVRSDLSERDEFLRVLRIVYALIVRKLQEYSVWVIVGNSAWQPDTRIVRYQKLWGAMKRRGIDTQRFISFTERMIEKDGRLKFFGGALLSELSLETAVDILLEERCMYFAVLPAHFDIQELLRIGWSGDLIEDCDLAINLSKAGGALIKRVGEFDDRERGLILTGLPVIVKALLK
ncbi:hypothetical protein [Allochromatium vinosum]|uniref:hypothetical protein n=1 Tax=Allochromatium vinosum TaxID=1049 RepID=UPI0019035788|nr:hypothetical protein [Allochromatium vinosum]